MLIELVGILKCLGPCEGIKDPMETIWLQRPSGDIPWGFRLQGGREYGQSLSVQRVTPGSVADNGLSAGDLILKIGNVSASQLTMTDAQDVIRGATNILQLTIRKGAGPPPGSTPMSPTQNAYGVSSPQSYQTMSPFSDSQPRYPKQNPPSYQQSAYDDRYNTLPDYTRAYPQDTRYPYEQERNEDYDQGYPGGYSTLPSRGGTNEASFRPVQQQQTSQPSKRSQISIQLSDQSKPQNRSGTPGSYNESLYNDPYRDTPGGQYQRQTSGSSYPQRYDTYNGSSTPPRPQRQTSQGSGSNVYEATVSQGFQPSNYSTPQSVQRQTSVPQYRQSPYQDMPQGPGYQRQTSAQYRAEPYRQEGPSSRYDQSGMYVDTSGSPIPPPYQQHEDRPYGGSQYDSSPYQRQPEPPMRYSRPTVQQTAPYQRQSSQGQQQEPYRGYEPPSPYQRQTSGPYQEPSYQRQTSGHHHEPSSYDSYSQQPVPPTSSDGITSFEDVLSPFENFQNSNYCEKLFSRSPDVRHDVDSGMSDLSEQTHSYQADTPRSNQSSGYSGYSPPTSYGQSPYDSRHDVPTMHQPAQTLLTPAPPAPPPPAVSPPPPPPPPPPSGWAPPRRNIVPAESEGSQGQAMPDKVLNTMLKHGGDKKPFSYVPSAIDIKQFRERSRQRQQAANVLPKGYVGPDLSGEEAQPQPPQRAKEKPVPARQPYLQHVPVTSGGDSGNELESRNHLFIPRKTVRTPEKPPPDLKQSEVYKMIQERDTKAPKQRRQRDPLLRHNSEDDEMRFSGLHTKKDIPSKAFQKLQKYTVADEEANTPVNKQQNEAEEDEGVGNYNEASIRYKGNYIPSPSFRILQRMAEKESSLGQPVQEKPSEESQDDENDGLPDTLNAEDMVETRYKGGNIPSRSFRALQISVGDEPKGEGTEGDRSEEHPGPRAIKVMNRGKPMSPKLKPDDFKPKPSRVAPPVENPSTDF